MPQPEPELLSRGWVWQPAGIFWQMPKLHQKVPEECGGQDRRTDGRIDGRIERQTQRVKKLTVEDDEQ